MKNKINLPNKSIKKNLGTWFVTTYLVIAVFCIAAVIVSYLNISVYTTKKHDKQIMESLSHSFYDTSFNEKEKIFPILKNVNKQSESASIVLVNSKNEYYIAGANALSSNEIKALNKPFLFQISQRLNLMAKGYLISRDKVKMKDEEIKTIMAFEASDYTANLVKVIQPLSICLTIGGILLLILGSIKIEDVLKPIKIMTDTTKEITARDLSMRIDIEEAAYELKELAKTTNDMIDSFQSSYEKQKRFVSDVSHEIKTPVAVILGYANMLKRWGTDDKEVLEEGIASIIEEAKNMDALTKRLLLLARYDKNTIDINYEIINFSILVKDDLKDFEVSNKDIILNKNIENDIYIYGDRGCLKEVIRIFLDNAKKYSKKKVNISVNLSKKEGRAYLSISDTGIGMNKKDLENIFDRFYRSDKSRARSGEVSGSGLGLSIAKEIVLDHCGEISVKTKEYEGSTFTVTFPICKNSKESI